MFTDLGSFGRNIAGDRYYNYKLTLSLGENGHNIPSVDFVSDSEGKATHLLAVDINGNLVSGAFQKGLSSCRQPHCLSLY